MQTVHAHKEVMALAKVLPLRMVGEAVVKETLVSGQKADQYLSSCRRNVMTDTHSNLYLEIYCQISFQNL